VTTERPILFSRPAPTDLEIGDMIRGGHHDLALSAVLDRVRVLETAALPAVALVAQRDEGALARSWREASERNLADRDRLATELAAEQRGAIELKRERDAAVAECVKLRGEVDVWRERAEAARR
jgi:hypothetical protein